MSRGVAERFGANLARLREQAEVTQEELAFRASLHRTEIGLLERGGRLPRIDTLAKLAGALEVEPGRAVRGDRVDAWGLQRGQFKPDQDATL